jgi:acyl-coenzyme A thioesterase PaaI-like protein
MPPAARSFVSGEPADDRLRVAYFRARRSEHLFACAWFGPGAQGPPGYAHGGSVAAVLDEAMGGCCWMHGHRAVAVRLSVEFLDAVPLGTDAIVEAWLDGIDGRKVRTKAMLHAEDGRRLAAAEGLFVVLSEEQCHTLGRPAIRDT